MWCGSGGNGVSDGINDGGDDGVSDGINDGDDNGVSDDGGDGSDGNDNGRGGGNDCKGSVTVGGDQRGSIKGQCIR